MMSREYYPQKVVNSVFNSCSYIIKDCLIDSGDPIDVPIRTVLLTHAHFDHIYGLNELLNKNPEATVFTNEVGKRMLLNSKLNLSAFHETPFVVDYPERIKTVADGDEVTLGNGVFAKAMFTPGHNPSCITWLIEDLLFTGDSLIPGVKTVTNLPGGNKKDSLESENRITELSIGRSIYPGHDTLHVAANAPEKMSCSCRQD